MSTTSPLLNVSGAYGGTVDTLVLGTSLETGESSSLSTPTISNLIDTIVDTITNVLIRSRKKGVLVVQGFKTYVSLRNYHHTFFLSQVGNTIVIPHLFLNFNLCTCAIVSYPIVSFLSYQAHVQQKIRRMFTLCPTY